MVKEKKRKRSERREREDEEKQEEEDSGRVGGGENWRMRSRRRRRRRRRMHRDMTGWSTAAQVLLHAKLHLLSSRLDQFDSAPLTDRTATVHSQSNANRLNKKNRILCKSQDEVTPNPNFLKTMPIHRVLYILYYKEDNNRRVLLEINRHSLP